jgi:hypothetical protein
LILRVNELLPLPPGLPDADLHAGLLRYLLLALALLWVLAALQRRRAAFLLAGVLFVLVASGFWIAALGRPYGLFVDPEITRRAANMSVAAAGASPGESFLVDVPSPRDGWVSLAPSLRPKAWLLILPTLAPLLALPALGVLVYLLWPRRDEAPVATALCLLFSTGDLDAARGVGFVPGLWTHPGSALFLLLIVAVVLSLGRLPVPEVVATALGAGATAAWITVRAPFEGLGLADAALLLTLDQVPWCVLAAWAWRRNAGPAARALMVGGAALVFLSAFPFGVDAWGSHAIYRLGLLLASAGPVTGVVARAGEWLVRRRELARFAPRPAGTALLVLAAAPACFLTWWTPTRTDPVMDESRVDLADRLRIAMAWVRRSTPPTAVFLASPDYAPPVAVLGGRRVLRAPTLAVADDDIRRDRTGDKLLRGRDPGKLGALYGLTHVFIGPGDFLTFGITSPEQLEQRGRFRLLYRDASDLRVYEIVGAE